MDGPNIRVSSDDVQCTKKGGIFYVVINCVTMFALTC